MIVLNISLKINLLKFQSCLPLSSETIAELIFAIEGLKSVEFWGGIFSMNSCSFLQKK